MAALTIGHHFSYKSTSIQELHYKNNPRIPIAISCQHNESSSELSDPKPMKEKRGEDHKRRLQALQQLSMNIEKFGKGLKDNLSPKQKGDWKDLTLMSLSFALYVYMSQKIVCAYCSYMSILQQSR